MKDVSIIKDEKILKILFELKKIMQKLFGNKLREIILYGSYARGEQDNESDIDIMILVDENEENLRKYRYKIADIMGELSLKNDTLISITEATYKQYNEYLEILSFYKNIYYEGIEIYGR